MDSIGEVDTKMRGGESTYIRINTFRMNELVEIMEDGKLGIRIPDQARQDPVPYDHLHELDIFREVHKIMEVFAEM